MSKRSSLKIKVVVELFFAAAFMCAGVKQYYAPRFALPTYVYGGVSIMYITTAVILFLDAVWVRARAEKLLR